MALSRQRGGLPGATVIACIALTFAITLAACGTVPRALSSPSASQSTSSSVTSSGAPEAAFIFLESRPGSARDGAVKLVQAGDTIETKHVLADERLRIHRSVGGDPIAVWIDDDECGTVDAVPGSETDVELVVLKQGCTLVVTDTHPGFGQHAEGTVRGNLPADVGRASIEVKGEGRSFDTDVREDGGFTLDSVPTGHYEALLVVGSRPRASVSFQLDDAEVQTIIFNAYCGSADLCASEQ